MRLLPEVVFWEAACTGLWLLTLSSISLSEALVAAACGLPCAVLAVVARRAVGGSWPVQPRWTRWLLPLPVAVVADGGRVLGRALAVLGGRRVPSGEFRTGQPHRDPPARRWHTRPAGAAGLGTPPPRAPGVDHDEGAGGE